MTDPATSMSSREFNQDTGGAKKAAVRGPVYITDRGSPSHVLLSYAHFQLLAVDEDNLVDVLSQTPGVGEIEFEVTRQPDRAVAAEFD